MDDQVRGARTQAGTSPEGPRTGTAEALHDVSNALTVILGWLDEAGRPGLPPSAVARALGVAARKAREARTLAREAIGATTPRSEARPIGELVGEVRDALDVEAARAGVSLVVEGEGDGAVEGAAALGHVLTNLLLNALAFSPAGAAVRIRLGADEDAVRIVVSDEGPGIDPTLLGDVFGGGSRRPGGAGIGLRHARDMVRRLGGDLTHLPSARGATFALVLPRHRVSSSPSVLPPPTAPVAISPVLGVRVLVLEDDRAVCALLDAGLGARGAEVIAVHDDSSLRARLGTVGPIDAVLLDLSPIAHDVQGALAEVRRALPSAGIVFISGSAVALEQELVAADARTRWVRKPFEVGEITQAIAELLAPRTG